MQTYITLARLFFRLGATAFGGPAAYIAMMRDEVVTRRRWLSDQHFLDLLGTTNLIPGPNAVEMAMHLGYARAGWVGLLVAGTSFSLPAVVITLGLAWAYVQYGATPAAEWLLYGIKPVIIPLVVVALGALGRRAIRSIPTAIAGGAALALYFLGVNFALLLVGMGLAVMLAEHVRRHPRLLVPLPLLGPGLAAPAAATSFSLWALFVSILKIGLLLYGSGYVLFAFLQADLVERYGWLSEQQLIDAIAVGQMTPGPLSSTVTFVGYLLDGWQGALVASLAIYLPPLVIVTLTHPLIPRLRDSVWAGRFLDGVNAAALGLMAAVTWELARAAYVDGYTLLVGGLAALWLGWRQPNSAWLVLAGAALGLARSQV
jgi:chromate transporter